MTFIALSSGALHFAENLEFGVANLIPVDPFDLIIFGGSGDLAMRKLLPALYHRHNDGQLPAGSRIISVSRTPMAREQFVLLVRKAIEEHANAGAPGDAWHAFAERLHYVDVDALAPQSWDSLRDLLEGHEEKIRAVYMATPPSLFGPIAQGFAERGLMSPDMRIVLEKPVGRDYPTAREINDAVGRCFPESQIYRIDHYLGKETVQNILALRFGNSLFEPLWRREVVDHVQITVAEQLGVENRIDFYDDIGALRDMVQNHMLQLLCLVAMEAPSSLEDDAVRDEKLKVLRALRPITQNDAHTSTVRAQYQAGAVDGKAVTGYAEALGRQSDTETFVAIKAELDNWRWSGVPFYLRTGKRLAAKHSEIVIQFKPIPHSIFSESSFTTRPNKLSIMLQPNEGVKLSIMAKQPGPGGFRLQQVSLDLSFAETFGATYPDAYERLLIEVLRGNPALFMRRDEVETAWQWIDGIHAAWQARGQQVEAYFSGSWGPTQASLLLDREQRAWELGT